MKARWFSRSRLDDRSLLHCPRFFPRLWPPPTSALSPQAEADLRKTPFFISSSVPMAPAAARPPGGRGSPAELLPRRDGPDDPRHPVRQCGAASQGSSVPRRSVHRTAAVAPATSSRLRSRCPSSRACRKRGLPVGSDVVESACMQIVGSWFKRTPTPCSQPNAASKTTAGPTSSIGGLAAPQPPDQRK